ncbi:tRNA (guanine-N(7)-)-methyltransferase [Poriferisphaera corsica]|uniref:tRNA (guanine-N(7)-)-methyltransferase n=1 Tax=Poriferisphaera corsica TaxID=2528020 RepID=A0A517YP76_9BACT|nr:tRNA (guanosine(46)-N7)-methyltransferase TrmB [Poriferisphaera corsica]QDU32025.1 tRNA (guanine-N(7)-)-methyltransferase [Poriferisphaera corsica]
MTSSHKQDVGKHGFEASDLPPFEDGALDVLKYFGFIDISLPLEIEIGSGKGTFLIQQAPQAPEINYLGIEYAKAYWRHAADRMRRHNLPNVRMLHAEAGFFLRNYVADDSVQQFHIYFPDPWPKARHNKRRLVQEGFLREVWSKLKVGGQISLATDHLDYFAWMEEHAAKVTDLFERHEFVSPESAGEGELVGTNFERKYREEGREFNGMILKRIG